MPRPFLTVGMATYDEYDSTWATLNNLRLSLRRILPADHEFVIVNNHPDGDETKSLVKLAKDAGNVRLVNWPAAGTASRQQVFANANGLFTLCLDCHVMLELSALGRLVEYLRTRTTSNDLYQGVVVLDNFRTKYTHMALAWRNKMFGTWGCDPRIHGDEPFEIPNQGLGLFCCRTEAWPGFNPLFRGFGGEEGYLHFKFNKRGDKCWCIPWLEWYHNFRNGRKTPYSNRLPDRIYNYFVGWYELEREEESIISHFSQYVKPEVLRNLQTAAHVDWDNYLASGQLPQLASTAGSPAVKLTTARTFTVAAEIANYLLSLPPAAKESTLAVVASQDAELYKLVLIQLQFATQRAALQSQRRQRTERPDANLLPNAHVQ